MEGMVSLREEGGLAVPPVGLLFFRNILPRIKEIFRIHCLVMIAYFVMQMRAGAAPGAALNANDVAFIHHLPFLDQYGA